MWGDSSFYDVFHSKSGGSQVHVFKFSKLNHMLVTSWRSDIRSRKYTPSHTRWCWGVRERMSAQVFSELWVSWWFGWAVWPFRWERFECTSTTSNLWLHGVRELESRPYTHRWNSRSSTHGSPSWHSRSWEASQVCTCLILLVCFCFGSLLCCSVSMLPVSCMVVVVFSGGGPSACCVRRVLCRLPVSNLPAGLLWFVSWCWAGTVCLFQAIAWENNGRCARCRLMPTVVLQQLVHWRCVELALWWLNIVWLGPVRHCFCCVRCLRKACMSQGILGISRPLVSGSCCPWCVTSVS